MDDSNYSSSSEVIPDSQPPSSQPEHQYVAGHDLRHPRARPQTESPKKPEAPGLKDRIAALKQARSQPGGLDDEDLLATMFAIPAASQPNRPASSKTSAARSGDSGESYSGRRATSDTSPPKRSRKQSQVAFDLPARQKRPKRMIYEDDEQIQPVDEGHMPTLNENQISTAPERTGLLYKSPLVPESEDERTDAEAERANERVESNITQNHDYGGDGFVVDNTVADADELSTTQQSYAAEEISSANLMRSRPPTSELSQSRPVTRWQVRWNGRPNYKKFRKSVLSASANDENSMETADSGKIYVSLVEYRPENFGIGDEYWSAPRDASAKTSKPQAARNILRDSNADATDDSLRFSMTARKDVNADDESSLTASGESDNRTLVRQVLQNLAGSDAESDDFAKDDGDDVLFHGIRDPHRKTRHGVTSEIDDDIVFDVRSDRSDSDDDELKFRFSK
ncbi:hypothetical protein V1525DRAFT_439863 [Lipomyces kononenkoae]|uniref:Uncharacterized protein n=1 Tax=Lipomyces kononenkoae TaxID=34357 RepID=A0ACC3TBI4_LIPKO